MSKHETQNMFYWITWEADTVWYWNLAILCNITKENLYQKNLQKIWQGNLLQALFNFQRIFCKKKSDEVCMLIWINFDSFAILRLCLIFCNMIYTGQVSLTDCVYFPSCSVKCISFFMLRHLMTSWNLNIQNPKLWFSWEWKELLQWNKKHFS